MEPQVIQEQTQKCPGMEFDPDMKTLKIEGRSIPENPESIYKPLKEWIIEHYETADGLNVKIILEYINSGSSKHLLEVLRMLKGYQDEGKGLAISWLYEEDDELICDMGKELQSSSKLNFELREFEDND